MSNTLTTMTERRETRFALAAGVCVPVEITLLNDDDNDTNKVELIEGEAIDFSRHGMKFTSPHIDGGQSVRITIVVPAIELQHEILGIVRWSRPGGKEDWYHGCQFDEPLPRSLLTDLAGAGYLERRQDARKPIQIDARIRNELEGSESTTEVTVVDFSSGGLRLQSDERCDLDRQLLLEFEAGDTSKPILIKMRPMWQRRDDDNYVVGCSFVQNTGADQMRRVLRDTETTPCVQANVKRNRTWLWLATAAVVGFVAATAMAWM